MNTNTNTNTNKQTNTSNEFIKNLVADMNARSERGESFKINARRMMQVRNCA